MARWSASGTHIPHIHNPTLKHDVARVGIAQLDDPRAASVGRTADEHLVWSECRRAQPHIDTQARCGCIVQRPPGPQLLAMLLNFVEAERKLRQASHLPICWPSPRRAPCRCGFLMPRQPSWHRSDIAPCLVWRHERPPRPPAAAWSSWDRAPPAIAPPPTPTLSRAPSTTMARRAWQAYERFLLSNASQITALESSLRSITYILPGRFKDSELYVLR